MKNQEPEWKDVEPDDNVIKDFEDLLREIHEETEKRKRWLAILFWANAAILAALFLF